MKNRRGETAPRGFTLLELLLSAALLGFVLSVVAGMISGVIGGSATVGEGINEDSLAGEIDDTIADDLAFLVAPTKDKVVELKRDSEGDSVLSFWSACGSKTAWSDSGWIPVTIHRVTYRVSLIPGAGKALFRGEEPIAGTRDVAYDDPVVLADRVKSFNVQAYRTQGWSDEWPAEGAGPAPDLIRVQLTILTPRGTEREIVVEAAPAIEFRPKPEAERRASGGAPEGTDTGSGGNRPAPKGRAPAPERGGAAPQGLEGVE